MTLNTFRYSSPASILGGKIETLMCASWCLPVMCFTISSINFDWCLSNKTKNATYWALTGNYSRYSNKSMRLNGSTTTRGTKLRNYQLLVSDIWGRKSKTQRKKNPYVVVVYNDYLIVIIKPSTGLISFFVYEVYEKSRFRPNWHKIIQNPITNRRYFIDEVKTFETPFKRKTLQTVIETVVNPLLILTTPM